MMDEKVGPQYRSRFAEEYKQADGTPQEGYTIYGYSGEDPYKQELLEMERAQGATGEGSGGDYEEWARKDPEGYAEAYYAQWAEEDPEGYAAYYAQQHQEV